jgi:DNA-binding NtrC family response regulator
VRKLIVGMLRSQGYEVVAARSAEEVLAMPDSSLRGVELVITDVVMGRMNGRLLVEALRSRWPMLSSLFISGYTDDTMIRNGVISAEMPFLGKPFTRAQLLTAVREQLDLRRRNAVA